jgi:hypothetical protein
VTEYLTKAQIFEVDDLPVEDLEVPEWGGVVRVRGLSGTERDRFEFRINQARKTPDEAIVRADLVGRCIIDEAGKRLFTDKEVGRLGAKSGVALDRVFDKARELSGMGDEAIEKATEDFGNAPNDDSVSG